MRYLIINIITLLLSSANYAALISSSCSGSHDKVTCLVAGGKTVYYTLDKGKTWEIAPTFAEPSNNNYPQDRPYVKCNQSLSGNYCFYLGTNLHLHTSPNTYLYSIFAKLDEENHWTSFRRYWDDGGYLYKEIQCQSNHSCFISGSSPLSSSDAGTNWNDLAYPVRKSLVCINNNGSFCLSTDATEIPTILKTVDDKSWQPHVIGQLPNNANEYKIHSIHCTSASNTGLCVAVGEYLDARSKQRPFLAKSIDGGNQWSYQSFFASLPKGALLQVNCNQQNNASCIAVGYQYENNVQTPLIIKTSDNGATWQEKKIESTIVKEGYLKALYCGVNRSKFICTAGGKNNQSNQPSLFIQSEDDGTTWVAQSVSGLPNVTIHSINCTGSNESDETCIATGDNTIILSLNGRSTWAISKSV